MNRDSRQSDQAPASSLEWTAFCYVANEMTEAEKASFEFRLENDGEVQQAVVDAIQQSQLIAATATIEPTSNLSRASIASQTEFETNRRRWGRTGILVGLAASLLLMVVGWNGVIQRDQSPPTAANESEQLAIAWANTLISMDESEFEEMIDEEMSLLVSEDESENWMFVALTDQSDLIEGVE